jgi:DNA-binding MarR family transcriptional regulator
MSSGRQELIERAMDQLEVLVSYRRRALCARTPLRDISVPQFHALVLLQERGALALSELAHCLGISAPSATSIVDRMEEHGYASRVRDAADRRVVHVGITDQGRAVVEEMMGTQRDHTLRLLELMTKEELQAVTQAISAVQNALGRLQSVPR